jgi:hypothetical protein
MADWSWKNGTALERADMVRGHVGGDRPLSRSTVMELFHLTEDGYEKIVNGDVWRPGYEVSPTDR